jgi:CRISPR-associated protein Csd1
MILQSLSELYDRLKDDPSYNLPKPGFSPQKIAFKVVLKPDGSLFEIQDARKPNAKGKLYTDIVQCFGSAKPPGAGINPCYLWDNQTYMLGRQPDEKPEGFGRQRYEGFRDQHLELEGEIDHPWFSSVCRFLENWNPEKINQWPVLDEVGPGFGVFQLQGEPRLVHEHPEIEAWWINKQDQKEADSTQVVGQCLVSGEIGPIARLHPKIKGVSGGQAAGASIVSFNDSAYESLGKSQSYNSPVSEAAAMRYGAALNVLLAGNRNRLRIGDATCVFWTEKPTVLEDVFGAYFDGGIESAVEGQDEGLRQKLEAFLKALRKGRDEYAELAKDPDQTRFYLLGLSPNAARISVRFFHRSSLSEMLDHLRLHHSQIRIHRQEEQKGKRRPDPEFPTVWMMLKECVRSGDDIPPLLAGALTRSILEGTRYPEAIYTSILRRLHMERKVTYLKVALIKAILVRNHQQDISIMLDPDNTDPAYRLGRLFAVLEKTQADAGNTGLRERFYSGASATPATVFPRILRTYTHHLAKLHTGMKVNRERLMQEIVAPLSGFPSNLGLVDQGQFAIGYYHQRQDLFTAKKKDEPESEPQTELNLEGASE